MNLCQPLEQPVCRCRNAVYSLNSTGVNAPRRQSLVCRARCRTGVDPGMLPRMGLVLVGTLVFAAVVISFAVSGKGDAASAPPVRRVPADRRGFVWRALARERGGISNEPSGKVVPGVSPESLDITVEQAHVHLDLATRMFGDTKVYVTRAQARYVIGAGPTFEVVPVGLLTGLLRNMGAQDELFGDARFNSLFVVRGRDFRGTQSAWAAATQRTLAERLPPATVSSDGTRVTLEIAGALEDAPRLHAVLDVVGAVASVGAAAFQALTALPNSTATPASVTGSSVRPPQLRITTDHGDATASLHWKKGGPCLWLTLPTGKELPPFRVIVRKGKTEGIPPGRLGSDSRHLLDALDGALLLSEAGKLDVQWLGIPTPEGLRAGAQLLSELAGGTHRVGVFR